MRKPEPPRGQIKPEGDSAFPSLLLYLAAVALVLLASYRGMTPEDLDEQPITNYQECAR